MRYGAAVDGAMAAAQSPASERFTCTNRILEKSPDYPHFMSDDGFEWDDAKAGGSVLVDTQ
jgi:hypothetical protein